MRRLILQRHAMRDLVNARAYYRQQAPHMVAAFALTVDAELLHLRKNPETGSPRHGLQIGIAGLRCWLIKQFPYAIFYLQQANTVLVIRVLHQCADIPAHLTA